MESDKEMGILLGVIAILIVVDNVLQSKIKALMTKKITQLQVEVNQLQDKLNSQQVTIPAQA